MRADAPLPKIKICGLTNLEDAGAAAGLGADFLGFIFAPSPRRLSLEKAETFWKSLPCGVPRVGVFRDQKAKEVSAVVERLSLDYLQFHGAESPALCRSFGLPVIRALSPTEVKDLRVFELYRRVAAYFLVDLPKEGGSAEVLPRKIARASLGLGKPTLLAGGLDPGNIGGFVRDLRPFGVDVARGVECEPGKKDFGKMREFFARARER